MAKNRYPSANIHILASFAEDRGPLPWIAEQKDIAALAQDQIKLDPVNPVKSTFIDAHNSIYSCSYK